MICEVCRESIATVHLIEIVNNTKKDIHLCENCAQQKGVAIHSHVKNLSIPEFFGHLVENPAASTGASEELSCQMCGITFSEFRSGGKLGCPHDYQVFRRDLNQLLEKIQSVSTQHRGRVPTRVSREMGRRQELDGLRGELKRAVSSEEYELAAELRDRIHDLEREEHCN